MAETDISIKIDVPEDLKHEFRLNLAKAIEEMVNRFELSMAKEIVSKSKFTDKDADELSEKIKPSMSNE